MSGAGTSRVAVLGLGIIGSRVADRLGAAGMSLVTWSRHRRGRADEVDSAEEAVKGADVIALYLKDGQAVRSVMESVMLGWRPGQVVINHSTVDLATTVWLDGLCAAQGCGFLDAPFTGSRRAAETGDLVYYLAGEDGLAARMDAFLAHTSRVRMACGVAGHATVIKLATNLVSACTVQALAEALGLVTGHGVSPAGLLRAVQLNAHASPLALMKLPAMIDSDHEAHFSLGNMWKDAVYACQLAEQAGIPVPAIEAVRRRMEELCGMGWEDSDYSVLGKPYRNHL